jgi:hypothetical protein
VEALVDCEGGLDEKQGSDEDFEERVCAIIKLDL